MKHKYVLTKEKENGKLQIKEYAELNKDTFVLVCETSCNVEQVQAAMSKGQEAVLETIRTQNFYPPISFSERILQGVVELLESDEKGMVEIFAEDSEFLAKGMHAIESFEKIEEEEEEALDVFIEDDFPDGFDDDTKTDSIGTAVEIDDEPLEDEED